MRNKKKSGCGCGCFGIVLAIMAIYIAIYTMIGGAGEKNLSESGAFQSTGGQGVRRVYEQLDDSQKMIYDQLLEGVPQGNLGFWFDQATQPMFDEAYTAFQYDHPECFWLSSGYRYNTERGGLKVDLATFNYWTYTSNPQMYIDQLNQKVDEIVAGGSQYSDTYDKVKYVHDYLVKHITYDHTAAEESNQTIRSTATEHALSVYGALVNGKSICGGYSESFYLLMNAMGVECYYLQGYAGEYHAWNYLKIDGNYYYMDVTWDDVNLKDANGQPEYPQGVVYTYFCITSEEMGRSHTPDERFEAPVGMAKDYNYFRQEGYYFETYHFAGVASAFQKQAGQQIMSVQFGSAAELTRALKDLIDNGRIHELGCFASGQSVSYGKDDSLYILTFYVK